MWVLSGHGEGPRGWREQAVCWPLSPLLATLSPSNGYRRGWAQPLSLVCSRWSQAHFSFPVEAEPLILGGSRLPDVPVEINLERPTSVGIGSHG